MNQNLKAGRRRATIALVVPTLLLTAAGGSSAADSPALHTFGALATGVPGLDLIGNNEAGGVDLFLPDGSVQVLNEEKLGLVGPNEGSFDRFGAAVVIADLNQDDYPDLVVGAPGDPVDNSTTGHVDVLLGSAEGILAANAKRLPSTAVTGDQFGSALAVSGDTLWVGAPGTDSGGLSDSGAVHRYQISATGQATAAGSTTEAGIGQPLQPNERFGEVLAPALGGVMVGIPKKNVGPAEQAGQVVRLRRSDTNVITAEVWNQNSPGVAGTAEAGDHFGAAVSVSGYLVGVPGEDVGTLKDAGGVQAFAFGDLDQKLVPGLFQTQDSTGIPGAAEAGDQYGASLAVGLFDCQEAFSRAVGAPGEDVGTTANAGSVTLSLLAPANSVPCAPRALSQGSGLPGAAEAGDAVGAAVAAANGDSNLDEDRFDTLLIGAPGEDIGTARSGRDVGRVTLRSSQGYTQSYGFQGGDRQALGYGTVLGS